MAPTRSPDAASRPAFDPRALDVARFAAERGSLEGRAPLAAFRRLAPPPELAADGLPGDVVWRAEGTSVAVDGAGRCAAIALQAEATVRVVCQRCLQPLDLALVVERPLAFAGDEDRAAALDETNDVDVLALDRALDLVALVEDELLLALPIVPRHEVCPEPLVVADDAGAAAAPAHPFAVLAALKRPAND